ncbi:hypothetical protein ABE504_26560 [Paenibacillus oryzisoli]|uniref:hypothetical protein n=1 Tax=Paenibacillus oryzisoli TaxID=1850517 RepID=UPI003D2B3CE7
MEMNVAAAFTQEDQLMRATEALKEQGVLSLQSGAYQGHAETALTNEWQPTSGAEPAPAAASYVLHVYVEKSRYRQAEDTLLKYGGQLLQP